MKVSGVVAVIKPISTLLLLGVLAIGTIQCRTIKKKFALFSSARTGGSKSQKSGTKVEKKNPYPPNERVAKIISTAKSYMGTPHVLGGASRNGIDCSGLVLVAYHAVQIDMPRKARDQALKGTPLDKKDLRPGDLVCFADPRVGKGITHIGIVTQILPNGIPKFIHTSTRLGVMESLLSESYFSNTFARAVRAWE